MVEVMKRTPITYHELDGFEVLLHDDDVCFDTACSQCMYKDWDDELEVLAPCDIVHGCAPYIKTYFIFEPQNK